MHKPTKPDNVDHSGLALRGRATIVGVTSMFEPGVAFRLRCDGVTYVLVDGAAMSFGRHPDLNDIVIGSARRGGTEDTLVSRQAGVVTHARHQLAIRNDGRYEPIEVVSRDHAFRIRQLAPGDELRVPLGPLSVAVAGRIRRYELIIEPDGPSPTETDSSDVDLVDLGGALTEGPLRLSAERRLDLAALCVPLLVGPAGRVTQPDSYANAAVRRGISRKAMEKRVEYLVAELRRDGLLPGLEPGANVKDALCVFAVRSGTITRHDLELLDAHE
jgi:hypothetical protein